MAGRFDHRIQGRNRPAHNPVAYDGKASDAYHLILPSLPGFGFSGKPTTTGWGIEKIAQAWDVLMTRLGYDRYFAQGGDWGAMDQLYRCTKITVIVPRCTSIWS